MFRSTGPALVLLVSMTASGARAEDAIGTATSFEEALATARAGNVIGGGDWAEDRIVPDAMRARNCESTMAGRETPACAGAGRTRKGSRETGRASHVMSEVLFSSHG